MLTDLKIDQALDLYLVVYPMAIARRVIAKLAPHLMARKPGEEEEEVGILGILCKGLSPMMSGPTTSFPSAKGSSIPNITKLRLKLLTHGLWGTFNIQTIAPGEVIYSTY